MHLFIISATALAVEGFFMHTVRREGTFSKVGEFIMNFIVMGGDNSAILAN